MASIVVLDDDRDIAGLVAAYLRRDGHEVDIFNSGWDGLNAIRKIKPALAVIDWMMPELDGIEVARAVRGEPTLDKTALLMLTARTAPEDIDRARDAGYSAVINKPFRRSELLRTTHTLLNPTFPNR